MALGICEASLAVGLILLMLNINPRVKVWLRKDSAGAIVDKFSIPLASGLVALGLFLMLMSWCG